MRPGRSGQSIWRRGFRVSRLGVFSGTILWLSLALSGPAVGQDLKLITIATGARTGVYYFVGGAICALINAERWQTGIRCITQRTNGSIDNLRELRSGEATFGIVQSDWNYHAVNGTNVFAGIGPDKDLRSVFSLYPESFTVIARADAGIVRFPDLLGKRVNIGAEGSGSRATMEVVIDAMGWSAADFAHLSELDTPDIARALCNSEIDAAVLIIAHPNLGVEEILSSCDAKLVPVTGPVIDRLVAEHPYYLSQVIPAGTYPNQPVTVPVFALGATLMATSRTSPVIVQEVVRVVFDNLDVLRKQHPALANLDRNRMVSDGLTAPFHTGAQRYFQENGLR